MKIYLLIGLDGDGEDCVWGVYEDRKEATARLQEARANWMKEGTAYGKRHADAMRMVELVQGFGTFELY